MVTRRPNASITGKQEDASEPPLDLTGMGFSTDPLRDDLSEYQYIFVSRPKFVIGTTVPEPVYLKLLKYEGGMSKFYEDAIAEFNGNLEALVKAAAVFTEERRRSRRDIPIRAVNGRVSEAAYKRVQEMEKALAGIRGMSRAKVLAGLMQIKIGSLPEVN